MRAFFWNKNIKAETTETVSHQAEIPIPADQAILPMKLRAEELCSKFDPENLRFPTTADIPLENISIGQERAVKAIEFGLKIKGGGFNIFVSGLAGTDRDNVILQKAEETAECEPVPEDICYVYNFQCPQSPDALYFPAGLGRRFKIDMEELVEKARKAIREIFCGEQYERRMYLSEYSYENVKNELDKELKGFAESRQCIIKQECGGKPVHLLIDGRILTDKEFGELASDKQEQYRKNREEVAEKIFQTKRALRQWQKQLDNENNEALRRQVSDLLEVMFGEMGKKYLEIEGVSGYLRAVKGDFLNSIDQYKQYDIPDEPGFISPLAVSGKYEVNLLVDNSGTAGAPVIVERNPSFANLFGFIEYRMHDTVVAADHLCLQAGSVHRARGGYLILEVEEILGDLCAWNALKKLLRQGRMRIENMTERNAVYPTVILRPGPLSLDLKVILTGDPAFCHYLYTHDDEFAGVFKVKAEFAEQLCKTDKVIEGVISFVAGICRDEKLKACDRTAVAAIIDYGSRLADHKQRLSAQFAKTADLLREANYHACQQNRTHVTGEHVKIACEALKHRSSILEDKIYNLIEESTLFLDTSGRETGQVNGVSVIDTGDYLFGVPSRITARTFVGSGNIVNIEREAEMSGKIHAKGILILSGYLGQIYAQDKPLALSASICFEQHYEEIDGDSASSAELYCLMSSLSGIPLRQDIAVTGSVDQLGNIQPVGGINAKIEGFFKACRIKGFTGTQGMIIPGENVKNLMLGDDILDAARQGMFDIYTVSTIEQGLQILTGRNPGRVAEDGSFQPGTIHFLVNQKLRDFASVAASFEKDLS